MCQIISLHARPETHSGTYKGILRHSTQPSYVIIRASRGLRGGFCSRQRLRQILPWPFLYSCEKFCRDARIQMSFKAPGFIRSRCFCSFSERWRTQKWLGSREKSVPPVFFCLWVQTHTINNTYISHILTLLRQKNNVCQWQRGFQQHCVL